MANGLTDLGGFFAQSAFGALGELGSPTSGISTPSASNPAVPAERMASAPVSTSFKRKAVEMSLAPDDDDDSSSEASADDEVVVKHEAYDDDQLLVGLSSQSVLPDSQREVTPPFLDLTNYKSWTGMYIPKVHPLIIPISNISCLDESGTIFSTNGALLPESYVLHKENPDYPWICSIRTCRQIFSELFGLGRHFTNAHRGQLLNDNQDGTLTIVGQYAQRGPGNGKLKTGRVKVPLVVSADPLPSDAPALLLPSHSRKHREILRRQKKRHEIGSPPKRFRPELSVNGTPATARVGSSVCFTSLPRQTQPSPLPLPAQASKLWSAIEPYATAANITPDQPEIQSLISLRQQRGVYLRQTITVGTNLKEIVAMLVQMTGITSPNACANCRRQSGPFVSCVVMDPETGSAAQALFRKGRTACANCLYHAPSGCSLRDRVFEARRPGYLSSISRIRPDGNGTATVDEDMVPPSASILIPSPPKPRTASGPSSYHPKIISITQPPPVYTFPMHHWSPHNPEIQRHKALEHRWEAIRAHFMAPQVKKMDERTMQLLETPVKRRLEWYPGNVFSRPPFPANLGNALQLKSLLMYRVGCEMKQPCTGCKTGSGPFAKCVVFGLRDQAYRAENPLKCTNCMFEGHFKKCSVAEAFPAVQLELTQDQAPVERNGPRRDVQAGQARAPPPAREEKQVVEIDDDEPLQDTPPSQSGQTPALPDDDVAKPEETVPSNGVHNGAHREEYSIPARDEVRRTSKRLARRKGRCMDERLWTDDVDIMEAWEMGDDGADVSSDASEQQDTRVFAGSQFLDKSLEVTPNTSARFATIKPGTTFQLPYVEGTQLCVVTQGKVRVRPKDQRETVVGVHGMFRVSGDAGCAVQNRTYVDAMLLITQIREG
jgi:hypothetical protein